MIALLFCLWPDPALFWGPRKKSALELALKKLPDGGGGDPDPRIPVLCDQGWGRGRDPRWARLEARGGVGRLQDVPEMLLGIVSRL